MSTKQETCYKIVLTDTQFGDTAVEEEELSAIGFELIRTKGIDEDSLIEVCGDCDGMIIDYAKVTERVLKSMKRCKVISRYGIGIDMVDLAAAEAKGVMVANVPDYCLEEVADHTMALYLACARGIVKYSAQVRAGLWDAGLGGLYRMRDRSFCLFGFGNIAQKVALRAKSFGCEVFAYDPYCGEKAFTDLGVKRVDSLEALAEKADALSIHAPLTPDTRGIINRSVFSVMKKTAILLNTSRGPLVNQSDLADALKSGTISAAGLDVIETEPIDAASELLKSDNVIITPHMGFYSVEAEEELRRRVAREIVYTFTEGRPRSLLNPKALEVKI